MLIALAMAAALAAAPVAVEPADIAAFRSGAEDMSRLYLLAMVSEGGDKVRLGAEADAADARLHTLAEKLVDAGYWRMDNRDPKLDRALWAYIVRHKDMAMLGQALPNVKTIANGGSIYNLDYAEAYDQWALQSSGRQRYGTQTACGAPHECAFLPMEDPDHVDARRAAIGVDTPAAQALDRLNHPVIFAAPLSPAGAKP